jgi:hypothetical protein
MQLSSNVFNFYKDGMKYILKILVSLFVVIQSVAAQDSTKFFILDFGMHFSSPVGQFSKLTSRMPIGLHLGMIRPTSNPDLYIGGRFNYAYHDGFNSDYEDFDQFGFPRRVFERANNHHLSLDAVGYYMPDWFVRFQPYAIVLAGIRTVHTRIIIRDAPDGNQINSFTYLGTVMAEVGAGVGFKWRIKSIIIDVGAHYLETTPGSHLLRKKDWRDVNAIYSTDIFKTWRIPQQFIQYNIGVNWVF